MTVFPARRSVELKVATAWSRVETLPMFARSRPSRTRWTISLSWARSGSTTKSTARPLSGREWLGPTIDTSVPPARTSRADRFPTSPPMTSAPRTPSRPPEGEADRRHGGRTRRARKEKKGAALLGATPPTERPAPARPARAIPQRRCPQRRLRFTRYPPDRRSFPFPSLSMGNRERSSLPRFAASRAPPSAGRLSARATRAPRRAARS